MIYGLTFNLTDKPAIGSLWEVDFGNGFDIFRIKEVTGNQIWITPIDYPNSAINPENPIDLIWPWEWNRYIEKKQLKPWPNQEKTAIRNPEFNRGYNDYYNVTNEGYNTE